MSSPMINVNFKEIALKQCSCKVGEMTPSTTYNIVLEDSAEVVSVKSDEFVIQYVRKTASDNPFFCEVIYEFVVSIDEKHVGIFEGDVQRVKEFAERKKKVMVNSLALPSRASLLIGNMINETGTPFISAPIFMEKKEGPNN